MHRILTLLVAIIMLILTACGKPVGASQSVELVITETPLQEDLYKEPKSQEMLFSVDGHEQARDIIVAYVANLAGLALPDGEWLFQDQTRQNSDDGHTWLFTNGPWVVQVSAPAISPEPMEFFVTVDHMTTIIRWEGRVDSYGNIVKTNFIQGSQPE